VIIINAAKPINEDFIERLSVRITRWELNEKVRYRDTTFYK